MKFITISPQHCFFSLAVTQHRCSLQLVVHRKSLVLEGSVPGFATNVSCNVEYASSSLRTSVSSSVKWGGWIWWFLRPFPAPIFCGVCICGQEWRKDKAELVWWCDSPNSQQSLASSGNPSAGMEQHNTLRLRGMGADSTVIRLQSPEMRHRLQQVQGCSGKLDRIWFPDLFEIILDKRCFYLFSSANYIFFLESSRNYTKVAWGKRQKWLYKYNMDLGRSWHCEALRNPGSALLLSLSLLPSPTPPLLLLPLLLLPLSPPHGISLLSIHIDKYESTTAPDSRLLTPKEELAPLNPFPISLDRDERTRCLCVVPLWPKKLDGGGGGSREHVNR